MGVATALDLLFGHSGIAYFVKRIYALLHRQSSAEKPCQVIASDELILSKRVIEKRVNPHDLAPNILRERA